MPDGLSATASDQQVVLSWSAPTQLGNMRVQGYQVEQSNDRGVTWSTLSPGFLSGLTYTVRGLTNGSHYLFRIRALTSAGLGSPAVVESMPTGMAGTPRDFAGTSPASGTARLTWSAPTDLGGLTLRGYKLEYNNSSFSSGWSNVTTLGPNVTSYDWTNLSNGTTVYFRLSAITDAGVASANGAMTATFVSWTATAPTTFTSTAADRQVTLNWAAPSYNGGYTVYGYRVEQSVDGVNWTVLEATEYSGSFISRGLTNGVTYRFRVAAVTARGVGEYSFVTGQPNALPLAPQNLSTTAGDGRITLNWTAPPSSGGLPILGYQVQSWNGSGWYVILGNSGSTATSVTVPGLTNGTTLWFRVAAITSAGVGEVSAQTLGTPYVAPAAAFNLVSTPGDSTIALSWTAPAANGNTALGGPWSIVGYRIEQSADNGVTWVALADPLTPASTVTYTAYGLTNGLNYQFRITALTQAGSGAPAFISGTPMTTPSAVQGLVVSPSDGSVTLNWRAPLSNGGSVITGYQLEYCTPWCATPATLAENNIDPLATSFTLNGLTNGSTYNFRLRARTAAGLDPNGATVSSVPVRIPGIVDTLTASTQVVGTGAAQATYVTLSWAAPLVLGSDIARTYSVELSLNGGTSWSTVSSSQTALSFSWAPNGVAAGTIVSFRVRATNIAGVGPGSIVTTTVPVQTSGAPPGTAGAPITLQTTGGDSQVTVSWAPPATTGGLPVTGYRIESSPNNSTWSVLSTAATSPYVVTGLTNGTVMYFRVAAITSAGVGATSVVSALPGNVPSAPLGLTGTFTGSTLTLSWSLPADAGGSTNLSIIERSTDGGATWVFVGNWGGAVTATIDGVAAGVATLFRVSARNSFGTGPGTVLSVTGPTPTAVSAVQNLSSVSTAAGATVSWTAPAVTGASTVTGYKVERSANGSTWTTISASHPGCLKWHGCGFDDQGECRNAIRGADCPDCSGRR
jgi:titin